eukprot:TRINITY_DN7460_c0_g1_i2.p1 TRINITY_DN7460_c0_g1~~TRINITY_DN7460_c0_g1_i2.p1  ORF type:complete len:154 (+),score=3.93 TRINITY_DN7460_c0_g1_i2:405-866(+)
MQRTHHSQKKAAVPLYSLWGEGMKNLYSPKNYQSIFQLNYRLLKQFPDRLKNFFQHSKLEKKINKINFGLQLRKQPPQKDFPLKVGIIKYKAFQQLAAQTITVQILTTSITLLEILKRSLYFTLPPLKPTTPTIHVKEVNLKQTIKQNRKYKL